MPFITIFKMIKFALYTFFTSGLLLTALVEPAFSQVSNQQSIPLQNSQQFQQFPGQTQQQNILPPNLQPSQQQNTLPPNLQGQQQFQAQNPVQRTVPPVTQTQPSVAPTQFNGYENQGVELDYIPAKNIFFNTVWGGASGGIVAFSFLALSESVTADNRFSSERVKRNLSIGVPVGVAIGMITGFILALYDVQFIYPDLIDEYTAETKAIIGFEDGRHKSSIDQINLYTFNY